MHVYVTAGSLERAPLPIAPVEVFVASQDDIRRSGAITPCPQLQPVLLSGIERIAVTRAPVG